MISTTLTTFALAALLVGQSPYAGEEGRAIKALSAAEVRALLEGEGMGLARAAELNHYPGPRHVLDLADRLSLDARQREAVTRVFVAMNEDARRIGAQVVDAERDLDRLFAAGRATDAEVAGLTARVADLQGRLRAAHLVAHLRTRELLTPAQVASYNTIRGYAKDSGAEHRHGGHSHP